MIYLLQNMYLVLPEFAHSMTWPDLKPTLFLVTSSLSHSLTHSLKQSFLGWVQISKYVIHELRILLIQSKSATVDNWITPLDLKKVFYLWIKDTMSQSRLADSMADPFFLGSLLSDGKICRLKTQLSLLLSPACNVGGWKPTLLLME